MEVLSERTYDTAGGSPGAADGGEARPVVSCTRNEYDIVLLRSLCDHLTNPPERGQIDINSDIVVKPPPPTYMLLQYLPRVGPVGGFSVAIVNRVTLVVDDFNHL